jgi:hypothetical protein
VMQLVGERESKLPVFLLCSFQQFHHHQGQG